MNRRLPIAALGLGLAVAALPLAPAHAEVSASDYGGFSTMATASPLKLEIFEPAIPIPTDPQAEFDFSYTRVLADSGPTTTARASALWPGPGVGEGLKTFGEQLGLPAFLTGNGYPVQANAGYPGDTTQQAQEFFPGMVGRTDAGAKRTVSRVGYTGSDIGDGDAGDTKTTSTNPLTGLLSGDLGALTGVLGGTKSGNADTPLGGTAMLGPLATLVDFDGMTSVSSSDYDGQNVVATSTSRIGELRLLLGLVKLTGVNVVTKTSATLEGGAKTSQTVDIGGMTIAGQKFSYGPSGFTAAGSTTPIPNLGSTVGGLLTKLGITIETPDPVVKKDGLTGSIDAEALRITIDLKPLRALLPSLPLDALVNGLPDLPGQAAILKGLLLSLNTIAPKMVLHLGESRTAATVVPAIDMSGGSTDTPATDAGTGTGTTGTGTGTTGTGAGDVPTSAGEIPPAATGGENPLTNTQFNPAAHVKGLPPLGSVPMWLILGGLLLAAGVAWYLRNAGGVLFGGGAAACTHGLKAGIPDLRKA
ncbi:hypothetical protein [Marmoricola sp. RAF53]|uniref:hypothetical protein n=1 Tax=Marmoricola sp. RAF53 TaxID=3233059 RepID=UPI003F94C5A0